MRQVASVWLYFALGTAGCLSAACSSGRLDGEGATTSVRQAVIESSASAIPCEARTHAVIANTGQVIVNSASTVDSYDSAIGPYGGSNVGQHAIVRSGTTILNNGGTIAGTKVENSPAQLTPVPVPGDAVNLPLGAGAPGNLNINTSSDSITLAPGSYVVGNLNVNYPGKITIAPAGQVRIWVTGNLNLGGIENQNGVPSDLTFLANSAGYVNVNSNGSLFGTIYAPRSVVNLNSRVFGSVIGSSVTLNSQAAVHFDIDSICRPVEVGSPAVKPPRRLPPPPKTQGCFAGSANGWVSVPCSPASELKDFVLMPNQIDIETPNGASSTIPFQFGQLESTFTAYSSESDSLAGADHFSIQGNTNFFTGSNSDTDWVQFAVATYGTGSAVFIQTWDVTKFWACDAAGTPIACDDGLCGCNNYGIGINPIQVNNRPGGLRQFDYSTVAGSVYKDTSNADVIGFVAQVSWYDPDNDPDGNRGLYAIVAPDAYGLASNWRHFSGDLLGFSGGSAANFTDTSVLNRTLAGSCVGGSSPSDGIPWPGTCLGSADLLASTRVSTMTPTAETNNMCLVGSPTALAAASANLVFTQYLESTSCSPPSCISTASRVFVRSTDEDVGVRPINLGDQPFWESPDLFLVPAGAPVTVDSYSRETLVAPDQDFDIYVRVNNDHSCSAVTGVKALVYLADPSALSTSWVSITNGEYWGQANDPVNGITVAAGERGLIGPFTFHAPSIGAADGHKCLLAAIVADGEPAPASTTDPLASFQVGQRNVQFENCKIPLTNSTTSGGNVTLTLTAEGATPSLTGANQLTVTFDDSSQAWYNAWSADAGVAYSLVRSGTQTTVIMGQSSVTLDPAPLAAGQTVAGSAVVSLAMGELTTTLRVGATLKDASGSELVSNGISCIGYAQSVPE